MSLSNAILRGVTGAFVLNSGLSKRGMPTEAAQGLQGFAATGVPAVNQMDPDTFGKFVAYSEIGIGAALLTPVCPAGSPARPSASSRRACWRCTSATRT